MTFDLSDSFQIKEIIKEKNFKSLYYYYGIVTMSRFEEGDLYFKVPNECVKRQIFDYMREQYEREVPALESDELRKLYKRFSWHGESKPFFEFLAARFKGCGSSRDGTNCEPMINGFFRAYLLGRKDYMAMPELELNGRYCDYALFPSQLLPEAERPFSSA